MAPTPIRCDIFCAVVDNFGDAGVCWRLARQLAVEHGWQVRLWIDDETPLARLAPAAQRDPVDVRPWPATWPQVASADVVIEAFACELPRGCAQAMAARSRPPVWINLEYLSAENWVAGCHGLPSPHPKLPLVKHFFFPGFVAGTGGLLRERDYDPRRAAFDEGAFRAALSLPPRAKDELAISLFCYENLALPGLLDAWAAASRPIRLLRPGSDEPAWTRGALAVHPLPFLPQPGYDELLWACDVNFVRGEDSFVRAQWAGAPFVWQAYPQAGGGHRAKLDAFLALHPAGARLEAFWHAWNGFGTAAWDAFAAALPELGPPSRDWARTLSARPDLAAELVRFARDRLESRVSNPPPSESPP